ncbi:hypothetical protein MRB53_017952 [Persea americana]|uniref:Uncharacterized protein n=1 Tax=Persea americana TaxID=3435 RepID=A0ACC2M6K5_PERAE|nr:hypothetical protein MRB53_017952 [Persea americana]
MTTLLLHGNHFEGHIPDELCELNSLRMLDLSGNNLTGSLPTCFNLSNLVYLHLQGNDFRGYPPSGLSNSLSLVTLDLSNNNFRGNLPSWIGALSELRVLLLSGNRFKGSIPPCIGKIKFGVSDTGDDAFIQESQEPEDWTELYSYKILFGLKLYRARTYLLQDDREEVEFMTKRRYHSYRGDILNFMSGIDLSHNSLAGDIPTEIGSLNGIHALNLSNNDLSGQIPRSFSGLKKLESLDLSYNQLSGEIPSQLAELNFLEVFTVAHNNLSGKIPESGQLSTFDESDFLGNPGLCGPPLEKSCTAPPNSRESFPKEGEEKEDASGTDDDDDGIDRLPFYACAAFSYVLGFWGFIALLYFNKRWRSTFVSITDRCMSS